MSDPLPKLKPIPIKERLSVLFIERCQLDVLDGAFVAVDATGIRTHIPLGGVACLMLEPGVRTSHAACKLAAEAGTLLVWVGEAGVRLYSAGQPGGARADRLLYQARLALDDDARLKVVRDMFRRRFGEEAPQRRSVDQLRGIEGARVRSLYKLLAQQYGISWQGRNYNPEDWDSADVVNRCLSAANHCLYGVVEAAVLAAGYAPAIGFIHSGKPLSFVYDIADLYKFETVVPAAFAVAVHATGNNDERTVRLRCRDMFRKTRLLERIIPDIEEVLQAGGLSVPENYGVVEAAIPEAPGLGDAGHRT
ncbi:type I-E CRISPR-associated endonuclease Cas1e [Leeia sp.]|uniref:type I-E CRISPR-associated endonuclease Cas1e n=1 Tax=Leeia sp. TaxID=2884678 RepID=UPI0035AF6ADF